MRKTFACGASSHSCNWDGGAGVGLGGDDVKSVGLQLAIMPADSCVFHPFLSDSNASSAGHSTSREAARFSLALVRPYRLLLVGIMLILLLETAASLSLPWLGGRLTDVLVGERTDSLFFLGAVTFGVLLVQVGSRICGRLGIARIGDELLLDIRRRTFDHLQRLPVAHHEQRKRGDQLSLLTTDAQALSGFLSGALPGLVPMLLTLAGALAMLTWLRPLLALCVVLAVGISVVLLKFWMRTIRTRARRWFDSQSETVDIAEQAIEMLPLIKAEACEPRQRDVYVSAAQRALEDARLLRIAASPLQPVIQLLSLTGIISLLILAAGPTSDNPAEAGELVTLLLYGVIIARPLSSLADVYGRWNSARGALARILETLELEPEPNTGTQRPPKIVRSGLRFDDICFGYETGRPVLEHFNLDVAAGERIAITGPNGSGKSTLVSLLMRFYTPWSGRIRIDGTDLQDFDLAMLRRSIALVPQRVWLFQGSIADNIRLGWPDAPMAQVSEAARLAGAEEFILDTPGGFDAMLGPRGAKISGGQQQRLALARALLRPAPILVFDEATSMFDDVGEARLLERIEPVIRNRCLLIITHRPRMLELAHRVVRMG